MTANAFRVRASGSDQSITNRVQNLREMVLAVATASAFLFSPMDHAEASKFSIELSRPANRIIFMIYSSHVVTDGARWMNVVYIKFDCY